MTRGPDQFFVPCELWTHNAERRMHHMERSNKVSKVRGDTSLVIRAATHGRPSQWDQPVKIVVQARQKRGPLGDPATYAPTAKAVIDGLVDAGLLVDDSPKYVASIEFLSPVLADKTQVPGIGVLVTAA